MTPEEQADLEARAKRGDGAAERALFRARLQEKLRKTLARAKTKMDTSPENMATRGKHALRTSRKAMTRERCVSTRP